MKRYASAAVVIALIAAGTATPAAAGSRAALRWEGAALALGAVGIIAALSSIDASATVAVRPWQGYGGAWDGRGWRDQRDDRWDGRPGDGWGVRRHPIARAWVPGHWEVVTAWVPGAWVQVWEPACRDRYGRHVPGRYVRRQAPGRYEQRRLWRDDSFR